MQKSRTKTVIVWTVLIVVFVLLLTRPTPESPIRTTSFRTLQTAVEADDVRTYSYDPEGITFTRRSDNNRYRVAARGWDDSETTEAFEALSEKLDATADYDYDDERGSGRLSGFFPYLITIAVVVFLLIFILRRMGGGAQQNLFALRNSKARLAEESSKVRFDDIGGCDEAREELMDIVQFLKSPQRQVDAGARLPRGVLLEGPPGCGKTLLARAVAGETQARFYYTSASEFVEMFIGVGPARVRDMFDTARKEAPAVLFIDEIDAIGRRRGSGTGFANEEREQTLNQILVSMDGFEPADSVVVIAATNRADILDKALVRAGRFDRRIRIDPLTAEQRVSVLKIHSRNKVIAGTVSFDDIAAQTDGFTGADLETLVNLAALLSVRRTGASGSKAEILPEDFRLALQKRTQQQSFDALDAVLFEATTQLAEPTGRAVVRATLLNDTQVEGDVVWVDPNFVKLRQQPDLSTCILPKTQIVKLEALSGTTTVSADELQVDRSLGDSPNFA